MAEFLSPDESSTRLLGMLIGERMTAGAVVLLSGDLGAGKTRFAQGVAVGAGVDPSLPVVSPTFTLINEYRGRVPFYHLDLYRLAGGGDLVDLGLEEYLYGDGIAVVEWPERLGDDIPARRLDVEIVATGENSRMIRMVPHGDSYESILAGVIAAEKKF